jgi:pyrimidine-nucleoside phosphorylase
VESPGLICASILSKKLAAGLDALVLDVKTGSGAFLRKREDAEYLAALMVATAEAAGTKTVALLTDMGQPLGRAAGNWIELAESVELLRNQRAPESEDLRELSLILAGWMIHLGGKAATPEQGIQLAEAALEDGSALAVFFKMIEAQGGDSGVFEDMGGFHKPGATGVLTAWRSGFIAEMDTTQIGWAVQRTGAGREKAGEPVDAHAGIEFKARRGAKLEQGDTIVTLYATNEAMLSEAMDLLKKAITIEDAAPDAIPMVSRVFTRENAEAYLRDAVR